MSRSPRWEIAEPKQEEIKPLIHSLKISPVTAQLLWNRGLRDESSAHVFLNAQLRDLADPFLLPAMQKAVDRVVQALEQKQSMVLYGDYDVDGVTSVAMLKRVLCVLGASDVHPFLPDRFDEGYGLTLAGLERCLVDKKPDLMIVLDCGTNSLEEISWLSERGIDVIVLDHHEPSTPANPVALVNYKLKIIDPQSTPAATVLENQKYFTEYCTAGLVFKFCHALLKQKRQTQAKEAADLDLKAYLDLVALATVADIAPLTGENRILTKHGLRQLGKTEFMGLRSLKRISGIKSEATGYDCGFRLGPRLNAAGRLESAMAALHLLLSEDEIESDTIAQQLDAINRERQAEEARVLIEARVEAEIQFQDHQTRVLVLSRSGWHEGVVGIVASRIAREFYLPTFVIALNGDGTGKGSGRSIEGFNLAFALNATKKFLLRGGGHTMAAGVSIEASQIGSWREALQIHARSEQGLDGERLRRVVRADMEVSFSQLSLELTDELQKLEPCGIGNPKPLFLARKVEVAGEPRKVGADSKHLKLWLRQNGITMDAIAFGRGGMPVRKGDFLDLIFELEKNEYQGVKKIQMNIREIIGSAK